MGAYGYNKFLVSRWDCSNVNMPDLGFRGLGNDLTGVGLVAATDIVDGIAGGRAVEYDGIDEYQWRATTGLIYALVNYSVAFWIRPADPTSDDDWIMSEGNSGSNIPSWRLTQHAADNRIALAITDGAGAAVAAIISNIILAADTWMHIVLTDMGGTAVALYANGQPDALFGAYTYTRGTVTLDRFALGCQIRSEAPIKFWAGVLDDVRIYSKPLTALESTDLYQRSRRGGT